MTIRKLFEFTSKPEQPGHSSSIRLEVDEEEEDDEKNMVHTNFACRLLNRKEF